MRKRCNSPRNNRYHYYGARGIKVTPRWDDFWTFASDVGLRPEGFTLDRIDNDGDYCPENCQWADQRHQTRNSRTQKNNSSGLRGVAPRGPGKWKAYITAGGAQVYLGQFTDFFEACCARKSAELEAW